MDYEAFGKRIRNGRKALGMTQEALSEKAQLSLSYIGLIERGDRKVSLETLVALSNALLISPDVLLQESISCEALTVTEDYAEQRKLLKNLRELLFISDETSEEP